MGGEWKGDGDDDDVVVVVVVGRGGGIVVLRAQTTISRSWGSQPPRRGRWSCSDTGGAGVSWGAKGVDDDDLSCDGTAADDDDVMAMTNHFLLEDERPGGVEEGEEEAPDAVSALATSLPLLFGGGQGAGPGPFTAGRSQRRRARGTADAAGARSA